MKRFTTVSLMLVVFLALLIVIPSLVSAEGTEELGPANISIASGSRILAAGTGMNLRGEPGTIEVDVPAGATVEQVLLYWSGRVFDEGPDSTLVVNGTEVAGTQIGGPAHFESCRDCLQKEFYSYRADITGLDLVSAGANTLTLTGMEFDDENNGAGVLVVYDDGSGASNIFVRDGIDLAYTRSEEPGKTTVAQTFTFAAQESERTADLVLFVASVKPNRPNIIRITVAGETTELVNELHSTDGPDWDTLNIPVTIPAGATEVTVQLFSESDGTSRLPASMAWIVATLSVPLESNDEFICADFSRLPPGASVEGLGTVHPDLNISTSGNAVSIHENTLPAAYGAPNVPGGSINNNGVGELEGFTDIDRIHDYVFTFAPGIAVDGFTVKMLDFGDYNPGRATEHSVALVAYDNSNTVVDTHTLEYTSDDKINPTSGSAGNLQITGDAIFAQPGDPGNFTFVVSGQGIVRVELQFSNNGNRTGASDPFFGLAVLCHEPPPDPPSWICADFSRLPPGASVEGLGTVHPDLNISTSGNAVSIHENTLPAAYGAPNVPGGSINNNGVGGLAGFTDIDRVHDYIFTFSPGTTVDFFTVKMLDFGDYNPGRATEHQARLVAYNTTDLIEDGHGLFFTSDTRVNPTTGSAGNLQFTGDAVRALEGQPGNFTFAVAGEEIHRVELQFSNNGNRAGASDPYTALAVLCFQTE